MPELKYSECEELTHNIPVLMGSKVKFTDLNGKRKLGTIKTVIDHNDGTFGYEIELDND